MLCLSLLQKLLRFVWNNQQLSGLFSENMSVTHCSNDGIHLGRRILAANQSTSISDWISIVTKHTTQVSPISAQISLSACWGAELTFTCSLQCIPDGYLIIACKWKHSLAEESYYRTLFCEVGKRFPFMQKEWWAYRGTLTISNKLRLSILGSIDSTSVCLPPSLGLQVLFSSQATESLQVEGCLIISKYK